MFYDSFDMGNTTVKQEKPRSSELGGLLRNNLWLSAIETDKVSFPVISKLNDSKRIDIITVDDTTDEDKAAIIRDIIADIKGNFESCVDESDYDSFLYDSDFEVSCSVGPTGNIYNLKHERRDDLTGTDKDIAE